MGMALSMGASGSYGSYMASGPGNEVRYTLLRLALFPCKL